MANLRTFTLDYNQRTARWNLTRDNSNRVVKTFSTKREATQAGVLQRAVGSEPASVRIRKENGTFQEERTFPSSRDPHRSKG